ncbi:hypothetical protein RYA94_23170 [Pseudomonas syringae pv. actinidiae]|nr:hypothetical protein [Pseudomonas syringae pv. actinidiae]
MLKELFSAGVLSGATVEPNCPDLGSWKLIVHKVNGETLSVTVAANSDEKVYVRLNAALMDAHRVGFRNVSVSLPPDFVRER